VRESGEKKERHKLLFSPQCSSFVPSLPSLPHLPSFPSSLSACSGWCVCVCAPLPLSLHPLDTLQTPSTSPLSLSLLASSRPSHHSRQPTHTPALVAHLQHQSSALSPLSHFVATYVLAPLSLELEEEVAWVAPISTLAKTDLLPLPSVGTTQYHHRHIPSLATRNNLSSPPISTK
jgi:hypothetical protein